jgi:hypothetical protein
MVFKMHLLTLLTNQLNSSSTTLRQIDFVEMSHLLLNICMADPQATLSDSRGTQVKGRFHSLCAYQRSFLDQEFECIECQLIKCLFADETLTDWEASTKGQGDSLCTWWAHVISCGLYWKYGDAARAQKHYSLIRKCPQALLNR